ncbi:MAG: sporulation initiation factor Spo0A C-terminal domain-containing protein [Clostridiales bacterium]|nr:sporulation initiation factor Spo0A C-terminal domain-containing protein [Clostridiales bacterium]
MNKDLYKRAIELVSDSSVPPHLSGFTFLSEAVAIKSENYIIKLQDLYEKIARNHDCTYRAITRDIAYAISQSEHIRDYLSIGKNGCLFNGRIIAMLALKLKSMHHEV